MKKDRLKEWISELTEDIEFRYRGEDGSICPISGKDIRLAYAGQTYEADSIEAAMAAKIFNGKSLNEISEQLNFS